MLFLPLLILLLFASLHVLFVPQLRQMVFQGKLTCRRPFAAAILFTAVADMHAKHTERDNRESFELISIQQTLTRNFVLHIVIHMVL